MGFEPTTAGSTVQCSAVELRSPRLKTLSHSILSGECLVKEAAQLAPMAPCVLRAVSLGQAHRPKATSPAESLARLVVRLEGLEPPTRCLEGSCSIHLSYRRAVHVASPLPQQPPATGALGLVWQRHYTKREARKAIRGRLRLAVGHRPRPRRAAQNAADQRLAITGLVSSTQVRRLGAPRLSRRRRRRPSPLPDPGPKGCR